MSSFHRFDVPEDSQAVNELHDVMDGSSACVVILVMKGCGFCSAMSGAISEVEEALSRPDAPPGSVVVVDSEVASQSPRSILQASAFPTIRATTPDGVEIPVMDRSATGILSALAEANSQASLEAQPESVELSQIVDVPSPASKKKASAKRKKTTKKRKKASAKRKKKSGGTRRRRRRRRGGGACHCTHGGARRGGRHMV